MFGQRIRGAIQHSHATMADAQRAIAKAEETLGTANEALILAKAAILQGRSQVIPVVGVGLEFTYRALWGVWCLLSNGAFLNPNKPMTGCSRCFNKATGHPLKTSLH